MYTIKNILAREILDSRGNPTVEVDLYLASGEMGRAEVPSGASTGSYEAVELRDGDKERYGGKGVLKVLTNVNTTINTAFSGKEFDQKTLDGALIALDGTENKGVLGANAILGVSVAFAKAVAQHKNIPLYEYFREESSTTGAYKIPVPFMNVLNGGKHAENSADFQEFMIVPFGAPTFHEALRYGAEVFHTLKKILRAKGQNTSVGDEGGYAPALPSNEAAVEMIIEAIKQAGFTPGKDIGIALDVAATELYKDGKYHLDCEGKVFTSDEMVELYESWVKKYPIVSIEDGFAEDDWEGTKKLTDKLGSTLQIVGDDLFVTNIKRLEEGIAKHTANSILIKLNQIGTVTETIQAVTMAKNAGYTSMISHRSGETEDTTIADFAVGLSTGQIKTGSLSRTDRLAKYNQLLRIEEMLGNSAHFESPFKK